MKKKKEKRKDKLIFLYMDDLNFRERDKNAGFFFTFEMEIFRLRNPFLATKVKATAACKTSSYTS